MKKFLLLFSILFIFILYFQQNTFYLTNDRETIFLIKNKAQLPKEKLANIKKTIEETYQYIVNETIETDFKREKLIKIYLYNEEKRSYATNKQLHLYAFPNYDFVIAHELVHALIGNSKSSQMLTQEGFAEYVQYKLGNPNNLNYQIDFHKHVKYFSDKSKTIPLSQLINDDFLHIAGDPRLGNVTDKNTIQTFKIWMYYVQSASFVTFLIEHYGMEKFEVIYNEPNLEEQVIITYGKSLVELEKEWHDYLENEVETYSLTEKNHPTVKNILYYLPLVDI